MKFSTKVATQVGKARFALMCDLLWKPFDSRFASLLERLQNHHNLFKMEVKLENQKELVFHFEKFEEEIRHNERYRREQKTVLEQQENESLSILAL